jgi:hypothetical protein
MPGSRRCVRRGAPIPRIEVAPSSFVPRLSSVRRPPVVEAALHPHRTLVWIPLSNASRAQLEPVQTETAALAAQICSSFGSKRIVCHCRRVESIGGSGPLFERADPYFPVALAARLTPAAKVELRDASRPSPSTHTDRHETNVVCPLADGESPIGHTTFVHFFQL